MVAGHYLRRQSRSSTVLRVKTSEAQACGRFFRPFGMSGCSIWNSEHKEGWAMKQNRWLAVLILVTALSLITSVYAKDHENVAPYKLIATISIPGFGNGFDISWVDSAAGRYYLANRGNAAAVPPVAAHIDVIDTHRLKLLDPLPVHAAGNGVVAIRNRHDDDDEWQGEGSEELWVGDA